MKIVSVIILFALVLSKPGALANGDLKIKGVINHLNRSFFTIETLPSGKRDTIAVGPDGSFSAQIASWPQLVKVRITLNQTFFYQWFAPGFDLSYSIDAVQLGNHDPTNLVKIRQQQLAINVSGYGSLINQYELQDTKNLDYEPLWTQEHKKPDSLVKQIQLRADSLWQATFPLSHWNQLESQLPGFREFAQIKQNELLFAPLYYRALMRYTNQEELQTLLASPLIYAHLQDTTILKCEECLMTVNRYVFQQLNREHGSDTTFRATYALMLPAVYALFPKAIADDRAIDFLGEIVRNYYYEDSPSFPQITRLLEAYCPADRGEIRDKLFARLNDIQARKQVVRSQFKRGSQAPPMRLTDSTGHQYSLHDFRGKLIYIDFWASWCGSCRAELAQAKRLYERFRAHPTIVFLTIAVHDKDQRWRKALQIEQPAGLALLDKWGEAAQGYQISYIPRYVLIGQSGELLDGYAPSPKEVEPLLLKYLN